ncbi:acyl-coenzyme A diphosphatase NUDT19 [Petromyzon marinus]|uniref:Acyl-coenzyme A diphosphatase NUDT19 n=1 Tax=Petromyzon marinus TaxID=7757 RepID=A0AAJ7XG28_PETMA|nr:nucleoside diphosphate-linked moiety X motif 19 [Petromyzon marinus]
MNTALKHWKEAATLVVAAGGRAGLTRTTTRTRRRQEEPFGAARGRQWPRSDDFDYEILVVKRSKASGFMPNASVFPGGVVDSADFHHDWARLLAPWRKTRLSGDGVGIAEDYGVTCGAGPRPPMFATDRGSLGSAIPGELAFRICAIRETFEESGVLIARPAERPHGTPDEAPALATAVPDSPALRRWRALVLSDARLFAAMCSELRVVPDVWALHEWSDWLTPVPLAPPAAGAPPPRRFDAVFFLCCLAEAPAASHDDHETVGAQWVCPPELLSRHEAGALWLAPPQQYEAARLCRVPALLSLADFARRRAALGLHRWMPVRVPDPAGGGGLVGVLPGDELYPAEPDEVGGGHGAVAQPARPSRPGTAPRLHRTTTARGRAGVLLTVAPEFGHLAPFVREDDAEEEEETKTKKPESGIGSRL